MNNAAPFVSRQQRLVDELLSIVDGLNDDGLARLNERAMFLSESHPRYPTESAEIISLVAWRKGIDKAVEQQRGQ